MSGTRRELVTRCNRNYDIVLVVPDESRYPRVETMFSITNIFDREEAFFICSTPELIALRKGRQPRQKCSVFKPQRLLSGLLFSMWFRSPCNKQWLVFGRSRNLAFPLPGPDIPRWSQPDIGTPRGYVTVVDVPAVSTRIVLHDVASGSDHEHQTDGWTTEIKLLFEEK